MTDEINEQISAFFDDELAAEESAFLVRRLESDENARMQFIRYATIGSALRGELIDVDAGVLRGRIQASLSGTAPDWQPVKRLVPASRRLYRFAAGFALAAVVATVALVGLRNVNQALNDEPLSAGSSVSDPISATEASYVVPPEVPESRIVSPPVRLTNYLMQHGSIAPNLTRTSIHSNVVSIRDAEPEIEPEIEPESEQAGAAE